VKGIKRCIQEYNRGLNTVSVIGVVMNTAVKETINKKETQTRPMNLCCLVPFFLKKIYKPTGTAANAKKAWTNIINGGSGFDDRFEKTPYKYHPNISKVTPREAIKLFSLYEKSIKCPMYNYFSYN